MSPFPAKEAQVGNVLLYAASVLIWGTTWFAINFQLGVVSPQVSLVYRYAIAAAVLFAWCLVRRKSLRFDLASHGYFVGFGFLLFGINYFCTYHAQLYISSALNAVAFSSLVWLNILNSRWLLGTRVEWRTYTGAALGALGIIVLFWPQVREISVTDRTLLGASFSLVGALSASFGNILSQRGQSRGLPVMQSNAWGMAYGTILSAIYAIVRGEAFNFEPTLPYVGSLLYLAIFGSVIAFWCYLTLIGRIGAHRAGYSVVMFPIVALCMSVLFEGLRIDANILVGAGLALAGNFVILTAASGPDRSPSRVRTSSENPPAPITRASHRSASPKRSAAA